MIIKTLSVVICTSLMLSACGGGSSESTSTNTNQSQPSDQTWTSFGINSYTSNPKLNYLTVTRAIKQGNEYYKINALTNQPTETYITTNGVYEHGPITNDGRLTGKINKTDTTIERVAYSEIGSSGLKFTSKIKTLNVSGKNIAETLHPYHYYAAKYNAEHTQGINQAYLILSNFTFPENSVCYRKTHEMANENYLQLFQPPIDVDSEQYAQSLKDSWDAHTLDSEFSRLFFKNTEAYIHRIYDGGVALHQGQHKPAQYFTLAKMAENFAVPQDMKNNSSIDVFKTYISTDQDKVDALINSLENSCDYFNETASKALHKALEETQLQLHPQ